MEHLKVSKVSEIIVTCMVHCSCVVSTFIWEILNILRQVIYLIMRKAKGCITLQNFTGFWTKSDKTFIPHSRDIDSGLLVELGTLYSRYIAMYEYNNLIS